MQLYRQVKTDTDATVVGQVMQWDVSALDNETIEVAEAASKLVTTAGVAQTVFPQGVYCWLLVRGQGLGLSDQQTVAGSPIQVSTADGSISDAAASVQTGTTTSEPHEWIGYAVATIENDVTGVCAFTIY